MSLALKIAKERKSSVLASNAVHHRVDSLTSIVALVAIGGSHFFNGATWLDPVGGLIVSLMVIKAGFSNTKSSIYELMDMGVDDEIKKVVRRAANKALNEKTFQSVPESFSGSDVEVRDVRGIKAGQNYLIDVELAVPGKWSVQQIRQVEDTVRVRIGSNVRGVRKVRVKFVAKEQEQPDFKDEFIGPDVSPRSSPEPEQEELHDHDHDHNHLQTPMNGSSNGGARKGL